MQESRPEQTRGIQQLADAVSERTNHQRHQPIAVVLNALIIVAFAKAAFVPGASAFYGALHGSQMLIVWALPLLWTFVALVAHRRWGVFHRAFVVVFWLEMTMLWTALLLTLYLSEQPTSPIWVAVVFTSVFWATSYPNAPLQHGALIVAGLASLSGIRVVEGGVDETAMMTMGMSGAVIVVFVFFAVATHRRLENEHERDEVREELAKVSLARERAEIEEQLAAEIGTTLAPVVEAIREGGAARLAELSETVQSELNALLINPALQAPTWTLESFETTLRTKCKALCVATGYDQRVQGMNPELHSPFAKALLRIAQELVRNAVTHGEASHVSVIVRGTPQVCLIVTNDGRPLEQNDLIQSTGGLANARSWLQPFGGVLSMKKGESSTTVLHATFPLYDET